MRIKRILRVSDFSRASRPAFRLAQEMAKAFEAMRSPPGNSHRFASALAPAVLVPGVPGIAAAAGAGDHPRFGPVLFGLAVLVVVAKAGGLLVQRWGQPAVLGELLAGIALGHLLPLFFGSTGIAFVRSEPTLQFLARIGVLILPFDAGPEADLRALLTVGWSSLFVALIFAGIGANLTR